MQSYSQTQVPPLTRLRTEHLPTFPSVYSSELRATTRPVEPTTKTRLLYEEIDEEKNGRKESTESTDRWYAQLKRGVSWVGNQIACSPDIRELSFRTFNGGFFIPYSIPLLTLLQIVLFYSVSDQSQRFGLMLRIRPGEEYGLLTYIFAHANQVHLWGNMIIQICFGVLTEWYEGSLRTQLVYWVGGIAAGLAEAALFKPTVAQPFVTLVGASGAIYALLLVGLSAVLMNYRETMGAMWLVLLYVVAIAFELYVSAVWGSANVAYAAHGVGALYGFLVGLIVVRNLRVTRCERAVAFFALVLTIGLGGVLLYFAFHV